MTKSPKCSELVGEKLDSTLEDIAIMWGAYVEGEVDEDLGDIWEYGLSFDFVEPDEPGEHGYWCWLLSWGGPSDEFRFYPGGRSGCYIEYWYKDWWDGAHREVTGTGWDLMYEIWCTFEELGMTNQEEEYA